MKYSFGEIQEGFDKFVKLIGGVYLVGETIELVGKFFGIGNGPKKNAPQMANAVERFSAIMKAANLTEGGSSNGNAERLARYLDEIFVLTRADIGNLAKAQNVKCYQDFQARIVTYQDTHDGVSGEEILRDIGKKLRPLAKEPDKKGKIYQDLKAYFAIRDLPYPSETGIGETIERVVAFGQAHRANQSFLVKWLGK